MKATHPVWAVLISVVVMFAQILLGTAPVTLLMDRRNVLYQPLGVLGITLASLLLVYLVRRFLGRQSWSGVGLTRSWSAVPQTLLGLLAGAVPVIAGNAVSVALGAATWVPWRETVAPALPLLPLVAAVIVLGQAFPEELLWRGHLQDTLSGRLSPRAVLVVVSAGFGALHIVSNSPADTLAERLLFVVTATALGFACAAARVRGGALWMAVGVHTGFHLGHRLLPTQDLAYGVQLVVLACALTLTGLVLLAPFGRKGRQAEDGQGRIATKSA